MSESYEMEWDAVLEDDGPEFEVLPAGEYKFTVLDMERGRFDGSAKLKPCPMAILTIRLESPDGKSTAVKHRLYLESSVQGLLSSFFRSIGQKKHGEKLTMNWNMVKGATGRCQVGIREYNGNTYNEIKRFLDPVEGQKTSATTGGWSMGAFG